MDPSKRHLVFFWKVNAICGSGNEMMCTYIALVKNMTRNKTNPIQGAIFGFRAPMSRDALLGISLLMTYTRSPNY